MRYNMDAMAPAAGRKELRTPFAGRNFAHRGYFGKDQRPPENSLSAFAAAVQNGYGMEMDVQFSSDRKLLVFHDDTLTRMTGTKGWVRKAAPSTPRCSVSFCRQWTAKPR